MHATQEHRHQPAPLQPDGNRRDPVDSGIREDALHGALQPGIPDDPSDEAARFWHGLDEHDLEQHVLDKHDLDKSLCRTAGSTRSSRRGMPELDE